MSSKIPAQYKGRIIFLHGFTQSSSVFYAKTSALRKKLKSLKYQAVYLNAPSVLTPSQLPSSDALSKFNTVAAGPDEATNYRAWWFKEAENKVTLDRAVETIRLFINDGEIIDGSEEDQKIKKDLIAESQSQAPDSEQSVATKVPQSDIPIVGLIGFSQGACLAGALVEQFESIFGIPLKFAVLYSGFKLDTKAMPEYDSWYTKDGGESTKTQLLHVIGELDTVVSDDRAYTFYDISKKNSHVLKHPGGHFVPNSKLMVTQVTNWILSLDKEKEKEEEKKAATSPGEDILAALDKLGL